MRTTLTLEEDIADSLKEHSRLLGKPFKQVVNDVLRRGMSPGPVQGDAPRFKVTPNDSGFSAGVDPLKLNQFNDELEVEEYIGTNAR